MENSFSKPKFKLKDVVWFLYNGKIKNARIIGQNIRTHIKHKDAVISYMLDIVLNDQKNLILFEDSVFESMDELIIQLSKPDKPIT